MDAARAIAITEAPSQLVTDAYKMNRERIHEELEVLLNATTSTAATADLAQGRGFNHSRKFSGSTHCHHASGH